MVPVEAPPLFELDEQVRRLLDRPGDHMRKKVMKQKYSTALSMARMRPRYARRIFKSGPAAPLWTLLSAITLQLARYFHFDDRDRQLIGQHRRDYNRLGFAIQLGTVRFLGTFLPEPTEVPANVITNIANQLDIPDTTCLAHYRLRETHWDHAAEITRAYGYHDFHKPREVFRLVRWLYTRAWLSAERPSVLFDLATARLEGKVLLPGVTVLERLVARVQDRAAARLWHLLAQLPNAAQQANLEALVAVPDGTRSRPLDQLRRAPVRVSGPCISRRLTTPRRHSSPRSECALCRPHSAQSSPRLGPLRRGRTRPNHRPYGSRAPPGNPPGLCTGF